MKKAKLICLIIIAASLLSIAFSANYYGFHLLRAIEDTEAIFMSHIRINVLNGGSLDVAAHNSNLTIIEEGK